MLFGAPSLRSPRRRRSTGGRAVLMRQLTDAQPKLERDDRGHHGGNVVARSKKSSGATDGRARTPPVSGPADDVALAQLGLDEGAMRRVPRLDHDFELRRLHRGRGEQPMM